MGQYAESVSDMTSAWSLGQSYDCPNAIDVVWTPSQYKNALSMYGITIFIMEIQILIKRRLYIESPPGRPWIMITSTWLKQNTKNANMYVFLGIYWNHGYYHIFIFIWWYPMCCEKIEKLVTRLHNQFSLQILSLNSVYFLSACKLKKF